MCGNVDVEVEKELRAEIAAYFEVDIERIKPNSCLLLDFGQGGKEISTFYFHLGHDAVLGVNAVLGVDIDGTAAQWTCVCEMYQYLTKRKKKP